MSRAALLLAPLLAFAGCRGAPAPFGPRAVLVPVVFRAHNPGKPSWAPKVVLTNGGAPNEVRLTRWPPDASDAEERVYALAPGAVQSVASRVPLGTVSSLFFEGRGDFSIRAAIVDRAGTAPPLEVPVVPADELAKPGDRLLVGPVVDTPAERSHFCFTYPGVERDALPFRVHMRLTAPGGGPVLHESTFTLTGLPLVIDDPWKQFHLAPGSPLDVDVTFLGSARSRPVTRGMWVYGITTEKATARSRFLETRVVHGSMR
jgi:hypothetical protein